MSKQVSHWFIDDPWWPAVRPCFNYFALGIALAARRLSKRWGACAVCSGHSTEGRSRSSGQLLPPGARTAKKKWLLHCCFNQKGTWKILKMCHGVSMMIPPSMTTCCRRKALKLLRYCKSRCMFYVWIDFIRCKPFFTSIIFILRSQTIWYCQNSNPIRAGRVISMYLEGSWITQAMSPRHGLK